MVYLYFGITSMVDKLKLYGKGRSILSCLSLSFNKWTTILLLSYCLKVIQENKIWIKVFFKKKKQKIKEEFAIRKSFELVEVEACNLLSGKPSENLISLEFLEVP